MSVIKVTEQGHQRTAEIDFFTAGSIQRVFQVICSTGTDDFDTVIAASGIPAMLTVHPRNGNYSVSGYSVRWTSTDGRTSEVIVHYTWNWNLVAPWELPVVYNASQSTYEQIVDKDLQTGENICNSANEPFDPALTATRYNWTLEAVKNYSSVPTFLAGVVGRVNGSTFYGYPAGQVMCTGAPFSSSKSSGMARRPFTTP